MDQIDFARIPLHARRSFASRPETTPHILELLAADPDPDIRLAVAGHPATPLARSSAWPETRWPGWLPGPG
jgi:hypothetical protein